MGRQAWDRIISSAGAVLAAICSCSAEPRSTAATSGRTTSGIASRPEHHVPARRGDDPRGVRCGRRLRRRDGRHRQRGEAFSRYIGLTSARSTVARPTRRPARRPAKRGSTPRRGGGPTREGGHPVQGRDAPLDPAERVRWWTVSTIAVYAGYAMVIAGLILGVFAILGFRHAKRAGTSKATA